MTQIPTNRQRQTNAARHGRTSTGQGLVEGACGTVILITVFVLLVMFGLNAFFAIKYSADVKIIATEAAKVVLTNKYWLGMRRPDYNPDEAVAKASEIANTLATKLGIPAVQIVEFNQEETPAGDIISVKVQADGLRLPYAAKIFPRFLSMAATGVSVQPKNSVYACVDIATQQPGQSNPNIFDVVRVPAFGFSRNTANGQAAPFAGQVFQGNDNSTPNSNGEAGPNPLPNGFGLMTRFDSKFFRGLVLAKPSAFDPRLAGTQEYGLSP
jgi:hypothetical protein